MKRMRTYRQVRGTIAAAVAAAAFCAAQACADQVNLNVALGQPVLLAGKKNTTFLKVGLTGFEMKDVGDRAPVNVVIVLDKSGSMSGEKIAKAKEAAIMAVGRLSPRDIVSVISYDDSVHVLVPATRVSDRGAINAKINQLSAGGSTALFAGVSKGASEVRKFLARDRANRIILLSDGLANVGPSSPAELGDLGASLIKEGIAVTTIGLGGGYNEDLMSRLAARSDGNHYFAENATDLVRIFKGELGDVLSVVAQEVVVKIKCASGVRPVRVLGREADITGQTVIAMLNQLYSSQEKYIVLEVEIPETAEGRVRQIASVDVSYANMESRTTDRLTSTVEARFTASPAVAERSLDRDVMVPAVELVATLNNKSALALRDQGKREEAQALLRSNTIYLNENSVRYNSDRLKAYRDVNGKDADNVMFDDGDARWREGRKSMRANQHRNDYQQKSW